jgi:4-hydroxy-tetrahydrodipicolinate synthase
MNINPGIYVTMVTPYNSDGSVDYAAAEEMVDFYAARGCDGIFASCQSSEIFFLAVDERVKLAATVKRRAGEIASRGGRRMSVVASGHVSDTLPQQSDELRRIADTGVDAVVLISNRLDIANTEDSAWIEDASRLIETLPDIPLGVYECPYPYKRLMSGEMIRWCISTGRFGFIKDTCCDAALIERRLDLMKGSCFGLYNANAQTLLPSLRAGASGYCGVMANFHPELYALLWNKFRRSDPAAEILQSVVCMAAFTESLAYPVTAKYHLKEIEGIKMEILSRSRCASQLTQYQKDCIHQMKLLTDTVCALYED